MIKIAITGLSGIIGRRLSLKLLNKGEIFDLYHKNPLLNDRFCRKVHLDLTGINDIPQTLKQIQPDVLIHLAAITHIDHCEADRSYGKKGHVWRINVEATDAIASYLAKTNTYFIYLSTECVFDGCEKVFFENSPKNPKNWYGVTKSEAEDRILAKCSNSAIIRAVIAYHENDNGKTLFGSLVNKFKQKKKFSVVYDQYITPVYADELIKAVNILLKKRLTGVFHIAPKEVTTPLKFAQKIASHFGYEETLINGKTLEEYFGKKKAALRLKNACLDGNKTVKIINFQPSSIDQILKKLKI